MISKELLSAVLDSQEPVLMQEETNTLHYSFRQGMYNNLVNKTINIHELAHKVKEWAWEQGRQINSSYKSIVMGSESYCEVINTTPIPKDDEIFYMAVMSCGADTEPEAIFKAGQWVLENRK